MGFLFYIGRFGKASDKATVEKRSRSRGKSHIAAVSSQKNISVAALR